MNTYIEQRTSHSLSPILHGGEGQGEGDGFATNDLSHFSPSAFPSPQPSPPQDGGEGVRKAFVVFTGQADRPWLRWLKAGYRHCFVLLHDGERWVSIDPMLNHTDVQVHNVPPGFDLPGWLQSRGNIVVRANMCRTHKKAAPVMPFTCVEAVKRVLGIHDWRILTPWQLYMHLTSLSLKKNSKASRCAFSSNKSILMGGGMAWAA